MKNYISLLLLLTLSFITYGHEKYIVIVSAGYNNAPYYKRMLDSAFVQKYSNWHMVYIDDCSIDGTGDLVEAYIQEKGFAEKVTLIKNQERIGCPLANQYNVIHACDNDTIIVILDGDDHFAGDDVLAYINRVYQDGSVWLTYGQFREFPSGNRGFCRPMSPSVVHRNAFRDCIEIPSHLRTFYAGLFKKIKKEDLLYEGEFFKMAGDIAAMFPMIEMARDGHFRFIPRVLLWYNAENPLNEYKVSKRLQQKIDQELRSRRRYDTIESPF